MKGPALAAHSGQEVAQGGGGRTWGDSRHAIAEAGEGGPGALKAQKEGEGLTSRKITDRGREGGVLFA